jgi:hypothetical protein
VTIRVLVVSEYAFKSAIPTSTISSSIAGGAKGWNASKKRESRRAATLVAAKRDPHAAQRNPEWKMAHLSSGDRMPAQLAGYTRVDRRRRGPAKPTRIAKRDMQRTALDHLICLGNRLDHAGSQPSENIYEILPAIRKRYDPTTSAENRRLDVLFDATSLLPLNEFFKQSLGFIGPFFSRSSGGEFGNSGLRVSAFLHRLKLLESLKQRLAVFGRHLSRCSRCRSGNGNGKFRRITFGLRKSV